MSGTERAWQERVDALRAGFDETFASSPPIPVEREDLLLVRASDLRLALRVRELASLEVRRAIVPVPGAPPALLGLAGVRGRLVPVFALAPFLGRPATADDGRWIAIAAGPSHVGFAFAEFEGRVGVPLEHLVATAGAGTAGSYLPRVVEAGAVVRGVVDLRAVVAGISRDIKESS